MSTPTVSSSDQVPQQAPLEEGAAEVGSTGSRKTFSTHLEPLQVKSVTSGTTAATSDSQQTDPYNYRSLSLESERIIGSKIEQLSQLPSPQLRELARRLGDKYNLHTPRYLQVRDCPSPYADIQVAPKWQEIQGSKSWAGLLDPIDPVLRAELVRYGELTQATYDAFDGDTSSKYAGSCKYTMDTLLAKVGLDNRGYEITDYLYATADIDLPLIFTKSTESDTWSKDSNWMGYVAVSTSPEEIARLGRRDIVVAWRGTITTYEWIENLQDYLAPAGFDPREADSNVSVESGFLSIYTSSNANSRYNKTSAREQVLAAVKRLVNKYKPEGNKLSITVVGHSLGSALAMLCGYDIAESELNLLSVSSPVPHEWSTATKASASPTSPNDIIPVTVFSYAGPRVGNQGFKDRVDALGVKVLRVVDTNDLVPKVPGVLFQNGLAILQNIVNWLPSYTHIGVSIEFAYLSSPFFEETDDIGNWHNLEGYLHLLDGFQGTKVAFKPTMRDYALANKGAELLKHDYYIPASWWQEAYKGLVRDKDGHWLVPERGLELFPATPPPAAPAPAAQDVDFFRCVAIAVQNAMGKLGFDDDKKQAVASATAV